MAGTEKTHAALMINDSKIREKVLYKGKRFEVVRRLPAGRLDLVRWSKSERIFERHLAVHRGPGGWREIETGGATERGSE